MLRRATYILIIALCLAATTAAQGRLTIDIEPVSQSVDLTCDPRQPNYSGSVTIDLVAHRAAGEFKLHSEGLTITSLTLLDKSDKSLTTEHTVNEHNELVITIPEGMTAGDYRLDIEFENVYDTQAISLYRVVYEDESYLFTQMEADEAREAFPCFDEPSFKIPWQLTLTVPTDHTPVSNTPIESETTDGDMKTVTFKTTEPMPSYLIAICVGPFDAVDVPGADFPSKVYAPKGKGGMATEAVAMIPPLLEELEQYFDSPYPYEKLDHIAVPEFWPGAMENVGAITYSEGILLLDTASTTVSQRRRLAIVIAHELAHMWFGNLVTMEWWDDLWLNEAFATWMGNKMANRVYPEFDIPISAVRSANYVLDSDARPSSKAIRQPVVETADLLSNLGAVYYKGQAVLNMFESWIGEEPFREGVLLYLENNKWGNATADDLWHALETSSGRDIPSAMKTFIDQPGAPLVLIDHAGDRSLQITQERMANYGIEVPAYDPWFIPLHLHYSVGGIVHDTVLIIDDANETVTLTGDGDIEWMMPQVDGIGYYRWSLSPAMMLQVANRATDVLRPAERVAYLSNLSALLDAGAIDGRGYLAALQQFADDPHPQVAVTATSKLVDVSNSFVTEETEDEFAEYVRATLRPALDRIGLEPTPGEDESISSARPTLIAVLADEGKDPKVLSWAETQFENYMDDPSSVDPSMATIVVALGCIRGDRELFEECRRRFENSSAPRERGRYLNAMSSFRDDALQREALSYTLTGPLRPQEMFTIPGGIARTSDEEADMVLQWLIDNYDTFLERIPPVYAGYLPSFGAGCSYERLERATVFFTDESRMVSGMDATLARVRDAVTDCVSLREREQESVEAYLMEFADEAN